MFLGTYANLKASDTVDPSVTALPSMFIVQDSKQGKPFLPYWKTSARASPRKIDHNMRSVWVSAKFSLICTSRTY
jgi:hypothetical protein